MDNKLLGNFIIAFPPAAYMTYTLVINEGKTGIDYTAILITTIIGIVSYNIGSKIKKKGEAE
jgi:hypothetical protein